MRLVKDYMSTSLITVSADESLRLAEDIMEMGHIRHLPVVDNGKLVGIVSQRDLFRSSLSNLLSHKKSDVDLFEESVNLQEIMSNEVITVSPDTPFKEAAALMLSHKFGCLPVVDEKSKLLGLITESDVLRCFVKEVEE